MQQPPQPPVPPQQPPNNPNQRQIRLEIPAQLNAIYSNAAIISQTHSEIILDFVQVMPNTPQARVQTRIVMTPSSAKSFLEALKRNLEIYEEKNGEIKMPPKPLSLADQLFSSVSPEDAPPEGDK